MKVIQRRKYYQRLKTLTYNSDPDYIDHILGEINYLEEKSQNLTIADFIEDSTLKRAFVRAVEVIGEAAKNISPELKEKYSIVPWRNITGTRDKLIHGYFVIDYDLVYDIVKNNIPELKKQLLDIRNKENFLFD